MFLRHTGITLSAFRRQRYSREIFLLVQRVKAGLLAAVEAHRELTVQTRVELGTEELAVALPHDSDLTGRLNRALSALQEDGTLDTLAEQYGLTGGLISG